MGAQINFGTQGIIYDEKRNPNIVIKELKTKKEYENMKYLESFGITPKIYGFYECIKRIKVPIYTREQSINKARGKPIEGEITKNDKTILTKYLVMEKIHGQPVYNDDTSIFDNNLKTYIDEIYRLYNILADKGITHNDFHANNILISDDGQIKIIDFDEDSLITANAIPLSKRLSKERLIVKFKSIAGGGKSL